MTKSPSTSDAAPTGGTTFAIETAAPGERAALDALYRRSSLHGPGDREALAAHPEVFALDPAGIDEGRTRVAREVATGALAGFATLSAARHGICELEDLFVDPAWMRRGVGRRLVEDACATAWALGADEVEVVGNPQALAFYTSVGFVVVGVADTPLGPAPRLRRSRDV